MHIDFSGGTESGLLFSFSLEFSSLLFNSFSIVNEAEIDVFLELSCFFYDPTDVVNLTLVPRSFLNLA